MLLLLLLGPASISSANMFVLMPFPAWHCKIRAHTAVAGLSQPQTALLLQSLFAALQNASIIHSWHLSVILKLQHVCVPACTATAGCNASLGQAAAELVGVGAAGCTAAA